MNINRADRAPWYIGFFGDRRLQERGISFCQRMCEHLTTTVRQLSRSRSMAVADHRFLSNMNVTQEEIEKSLAAKTNENSQALDHVLVIHDTSEIAFSTQPVKKRMLGPTTLEDIPGFFIHPNVVINPENGDVLGLAGVHAWQREPAEKAWNRCAVRWTTGVPQEHPVETQRFPENAAYIRVCAPEGDFLFYINKREQEWTEIKITQEKMACLDAVIGSGPAARILSKQEVKGIRDLTRHRHTRVRCPYQWIEEKESHKWLDALYKADRYLDPAIKKTFVSDRESDVYEYVSTVMRFNHDCVIRSSADRRVANGTLLSQQVTQETCKETYTVELSQTPKRKKRTATLHLKYGAVSICRPKKVKGHQDYPEQLAMHFVDVEEDPSSDPHDGTRIHWRLLTTHAVSTVEEARKIVDYYLLRWTIEMLFATIKKKGLGIEASQLQSFEKLLKLVTIALHAGIKIFHLLACRDGQRDTEASLIFSSEQLLFLSLLTKKLEGKTEKQKNTFQPHKMSWAAWAIARLGGWKGYQQERPPGHFTFSTGLRKFQNMFEGWQLANV